MEILALIILIPTLLVVIYQDFKERLISWWLVPLLFVSFVLGHYSESVMESLTKVVSNWSFLLLQYLLLSLYFSIKQKVWVNIANQYIGWGDIWFLVMIAFAFSFIHFILVFVSGLVFSLLLFFILKSTKIIKQKTVPLAGTFSVYLIIIHLGAYFAHYNLMSDEGLIIQIYSMYV